ncbi:MAG: sugar phosphate isomerase/epimerase [Phycisphaerae bacterium]|nr:sugar phosphate isomerase/epimerase [Phycisphaerae bacterium]
MMKPLDIGVCSWSLKQPDLVSACKVAKEQLGLSLMQVGFFDTSVLDEANDDKILSALGDNGIEASATCIGYATEDYSSIAQIAKTGGYLPDEYWDERFKLTLRVRDISAKLGAKMLMTHIGFVPHDSSAPAYATMVERLKKVTDALGEKGITLVMETGQEPPDALIGFIAAVGRENIRVNFDPANMILYGVGKPVEAVDVLKDYISHVHAKDATWSKAPGKEWGQEVVLGTGDADVPRIVQKLKSYGYAGPLVIEREAGDERISDVRTGIDLLRSLV